MSFLVVVIGVLALVAVMTKMKTPDDIAIQALWVVGACGIFTVGGQSLVDAVTRWKGVAVPETKPEQKESSSTPAKS